MGVGSGEGSLVPLPPTERQNPARRPSPRRGFALAVLRFDRSIARSLKFYAKAQIRQGADRESAAGRLEGGVHSRRAGAVGLTKPSGKPRVTKTTLTQARTLSR